MIIDIVEVPIKLPPYTDVNTEAVFWTRTSPWYEAIVEDVLLIGRRFDSNEHIHRYKIIESRVGMIIERSVLTLDELDTTSLYLKDTKGESIPIYPITTKIHMMENGSIKTRAYRHLNSIRELISKIYKVEPEDVCSVHDLFIKVMLTTLANYQQYDAEHFLSKYQTSNQHRLNALLCAEEISNIKLCSNISSVVETCMDLSNTCTTADEVVETVDTFSKLPKLESLDPLSILFTQNPYIESIQLKNHLAPSYHLRQVSVSIASHDIFNLDGSVQYEVPEGLRWMLYPLINELELLPYTDLSVTFSEKGNPHVHYGLSRFGMVPSIESYQSKNKLSIALVGDEMPFSNWNNPTLLNDLQLCIAKFILHLNLKLHLRDLEYTLVKTFHDDAYLSIRCKRTNKTIKYYFDLTLYALGSRGILNASVFNHLRQTSTAHPHLF